MRLVTRIAFVILASALALSAGALLFGDEAVELSAVPDVVKQAAVEKLPGFAIRSAEKERGADGVIYELEGVAGGTLTGGTGAGMMQDMMSQNMQFLALQDAIQQESRTFQTLSNATQARHDVAMSSMRNTRA